MLTIDEIKGIGFRPIGKKGYVNEDVDRFVDDVIETVEQLNAEKADLLRKLDVLAKKVEQYREDEETVRNALITSQKLSDSTLKEAQDKAAYIIKSAEKKSRSILTEAEMATEREKDRFEALHAETAKLRREIVAIYKKHLSAVEGLPTEEDVKAKRQELDEKYPFEPVEDIAAAAAEEDVKIAKSEKKAEPETTVREEVKASKHAAAERFEELQFGDNYDVE